MTNESSITDFTLPIANVVCFSPNGLPSTAVNCFNVGANANHADSIRVHAFQSKAAIKALRCEWTKDCQSPVTHLDRKGYVYCTHHAASSGRGRKLTASELRRMEAR